MFSFASTYKSAIQYKKEHQKCIEMIRTRKKEIEKTKDVRKIAVEKRMRQEVKKCLKDIEKLSKGMNISPSRGMRIINTRTLLMHLKQRQTAMRYIRLTLNNLSLMAMPNLPFGLRLTRNEIKLLALIRDYKRWVVELMFKAMFKENRKIQRSQLIHYHERSIRSKQEQNRGGHQKFLTKFGNVGRCRVRIR